MNVIEQSHHRIAFEGEGDALPSPPFILSFPVEDCTQWKAGLACVAEGQEKVPLTRPQHIPAGQVVGEGKHARASAEAQGCAG